MPPAGRRGAQIARLDHDYALDKFGCFGQDENVREQPAGQRT